MAAIINFKGNVPDSEGKVWASYIKIIGTSEECVIDVFMNDMNKVKYSLTDGIIASTNEKNIVVAQVSNNPGVNVSIGLSIRKSSDPVSTKPQKNLMFFDFSFKSKP